MFIVYLAWRTASTIKAKCVDEDSQPKPARRVLPEHEGRYKITLPSGTTERSKEILAKKAMCKCLRGRYISVAWTVFGSVGRQQTFLG